MTPPKPPKKPKYQRRGQNTADIEIDQDTTCPSEQEFKEDMEALLGQGSQGKTAAIRGKDVLLSQPTLVLIAKRAKKAGYKVRVHINGSEDKSLLLPPVFEFTDEVGEE